jgi:hypothetical protein
MLERRDVDRLCIALLDWDDRLQKYSGNSRSNGVAFYVPPIPDGGNRQASGAGRQVAQGAVRAANYRVVAAWSSFLLLIGAGAFALGMAIHNQAIAQQPAPPAESIYYCATGVQSFYGSRDHAIDQRRITTDHGCAARDVQLSEDAPKLGCHGPLADPQSKRDVFCGAALRTEHRDLQFASGVTARDFIRFPALPVQRLDGGEFEFIDLEATRLTGHQSRRGLWSENDNEHAIVNYNATDSFAWSAVVSIRAFDAGNGSITHLKKLP